MGFGWRSVPPSQDKCSALIRLAWEREWQQLPQGGGAKIGRRLEGGRVEGGGRGRGREGRSGLPAGGLLHITLQFFCPRWRRNPTSMTTSTLWKRTMTIWVARKIHKLKSIGGYLSTLTPHPLCSSCIAPWAHPCKPYTTTLVNYFNYFSCT